MRCTTAVCWSKYTKVTRGSGDFSKWLPWYVMRLFLCSCCVKANIKSIINQTENPRLRLKSWKNKNNFLQFRSQMSKRKKSYSISYFLIILVSGEPLFYLYTFIQIRLNSKEHNIENRTYTFHGLIFIDPCGDVSLSSSVKGGWMSLSTPLNSLCPCRQTDGPLRTLHM